MATLALSLVGYAVGGPFGALIGSFAGKFIDQKLFAPGPIQQEGPRLTSLKVMASQEGAPVLRTYGRMRLSPQMIWATDFREVATTQTQSGGKGGGGGQTVTQTTYSYFVSFAVGLCEGEIVDIGQVWADGTLLDLSKFTHRLYKGTETQSADPKIEAVEGTGKVPGFRGLAYLVFEEMALEQFGNRIPQITVEVIRRPPSSEARLEDILPGVTLIPGLGEFAYATDTVFKDGSGLGAFTITNQQSAAGKANLLVSLDQLQSAAPNLGAVSLVVSWHGTDLRCASCQIKPKVESATGDATFTWPWQVSGIDRSTADIVSTDSNGPLLGGAPSDRSVFQAITELKARGFRVILYPFVTMDVPPGNTLPNPYSNGAATAGQPTFPWRGRITCSPAAGYTGTVDKTATAATQVATFFGSAAAGDFGAWDGSTIAYSGPAEWSYRRMILHYAHLAVAAGGVDGFLIGSEMVALNTVRSDASTFPTVTKLATLAADVKGIVGSCKVSYGADWSEYANFRPSDGSNDVYFHLDPLWSDSHVDFIGIDNYMPLSDWRAGRNHLDALAGVPSIYDKTYLQGNIEGGELYNWFYASLANRNTQTRTNVTDATYGEPWVFRYKDFKNWWLNSHHNRPAGVRSGSATGWTPQSKPIWFTEFGCPAVDKGANEPNVFYDPKSSESFFPYFSTGVRDDLIQRVFLEALIDYWDPANGHNPTSSVYHAPMIDTASLFAWTWDARPYPQFPDNSSVWRDGSNWQHGHWLTGRLGLVTLRDVVSDICTGLGISIDATTINGMIAGYTVDNVMSPRNALAPLMQLYFFDAVESNGAIRFVQRGGSVVASYGLSQLVDVGGGSANSAGQPTSYYSLVRAQESDLPRTVHLQFLDPNADYQNGDVYARRLKGSSDNTIEITPAIVFDQGIAQSIVDILLVDAWVMREKSQLALPPSSYVLEPTDIINLSVAGRNFQMRLEELGYQHTRPAKLTRTDDATYIRREGPAATRQNNVAQIGPAVLQIMDLPILVASETPGVPRFACYADPWAGVNVFRSPASTGFTLDGTVANRATVGKTLSDFYSGPTGRWDPANDLYVQIPATQTLASADDLLVLNGANSCAVRNADGEWEILQFATAELTAPNQYKLSRLLRGQLGSEYAMRDPVPAGAVFVFLDSTVTQASVPVGLRSNALNWKWGPATKPIDDATYQSETFTFTGIGLRPYSPVHLTALWQASGDIQLGWVRRTRIDGDPWDPPDVPLGEESEQYQLEILSADGSTVVRTINGLGAPAYLYTAAMQTTDFGAPLSSIKFKVAQVSASYGAGTFRSYP